MASRPAVFRQSDLQRALRAARCAGLDVKQVEIDPTTGKIIITTTTSGAEALSLNPLDKWLASNARST